MAENSNINRSNAWISILRGQQQNLAQLSERTEKEFLSHGSKLAESLSCLKKIFEHSSLITTVMGSNDQKSPLLSSNIVFNESLSTLETYDMEIKKRLEQIRIIAARLEKFSKWQSNFRTLTQSLGIVSLNVKIHSDILDSNENSKIFADEGKNFTSYYTKNIKEIFYRVSQLRVMIKNILNEVRIHIEEHQNKVKSAKEQITSIIKTINKLFNSSSELSVEIKNGSSKISDKVENIVKSLQLQDISQQRLSHVINAIDDICTQIEGDAIKKEDNSKLHLVSQIAFLQLSHINLVKQDMIAAGATMIDDLNVIFENIYQHSDSIKRLTGISRDNQYALIIEKLQDEMNNIISSLSENIDINRYLIAEVDTINQTTGETSGFIEELERISDDLRLLAVNARVNATQPEYTDIVLKVLADETKAISITATNLTEDVLKDLNWILDVINELKISFNEVFEKNIQDSKILADKISKACNGLEGLKNIVKDNIQTIDQSSKQLTFIFNNLISSIYFPEIVSDSLETVIDSMNIFIKQTREILDDDMINIVHDNIDDLAGRYTIHTEHKCHNIAAQNIVNNTSDEITTEEDDDVSGSIELF